MWPTGQPGLYLRCFVGRIVIHYQMHLRPLRHATVDLLEEAEKFLRTVAFVALADNEAGGDIERCKQGSGSTWRT